MVFERGWWNHEDEESAVLEGVWQALQITRGASSAIILEKSYFFHSESSLAPGIHFSTDMLKEGAWKALRGRIALPLQKGWLRVPQSPHEGRGTQPALLQASGQGRGEVPALAGSRAVCPPCLPCFWLQPWVAQSQGEYPPLCLEPASSSPRHLSSRGKSSPSVWGRQVTAEAGPRLTHPGRAGLHSTE